MKTFKEVKVGDYIYKIKSATELIVGRVNHISVTDDCISYLVREFGLNGEEYNWPIEKWAEDSEQFEWPYGLGRLVTWIPPLLETGPGKYILNKNGNEYTMLTDNFMFKDKIPVVYELDETGNAKPKNCEEYEWRRGLILYRAEYPNEDGQLFARLPKDFYSKFTRIG